MNRWPRLVERIDRFLPPGYEQLNIERLNAARLLVMSCWAFAIPGVLLLLLTTALDPALPPPRILGFGFVSLVMLVPPLFRRLGSYRFFSWLIVAIYQIAALTLVFFNGGLGSFMTISLVCSPFFAGLLLGIRASTGLVIATIVAILVINQLQFAGLLPPPVAPAALLPTLYPTVLIICLLAVALVTELFLHQERSIRRALDEQWRRAEDANQAKSRFLAVMSHELRTPMTGIMSALELLEQSALDERQRATLTSLRHSASAQLELLDDLLDHSSLEAGGVSLRTRRFNLETLVRGVVDSYRLVAEQKGVRLEMQASGPVCPALHGDSGRLRQILANLVSNAVKFTHEGHVRVSYKAEGKDSEDRRISIEVTDTGIGIDPAQRQKLFQPFIQADSSNTREYGGTGLGLSICRGLIELLGGEIDMDSRPGVGTQVRVRLKMPVAGDRNKQQQGRLSVKNARILLAEDSVVNRTLMEQMLETRGHRVTSVGNGSEALEAARANCFDLILLDVQMPGMDGPDVARHIRREEAGCNTRVPIMMITADLATDYVSRFLESGVDRMLSKPVDWQQLDAMMSELLNPTASD